MKDKKDLNETYKTYIKTSAVGLEVGLSIVVGALAGYFFDRHFETRPWGLFVGFLIGILAAGRRLYAFAKAYLKENRNGDDSKKPDA